MADLIYDLHIHSCLSPCADMYMTPNNIAGMAALGGVRVAALTDHNTSRNCPAFFSACGKHGIVPMAGMELTTLEEIHVVCLFPTLGGAMDFDEFVASRRMNIKNRPDIFGQQVVMNEQDEIIGYEDMLLIAATEIDLNEAVSEVRARGGAAFPAHIDRQANSLLSILGDFPIDPCFTAAEIYDYSKLEELKRRYPILSNLKLVKNSDAHRLEGMMLEPRSLGSADDGLSDDEVRKRIIAWLAGEV